METCVRLVYWCGAAMTEAVKRVAMQVSLSYLVSETLARYALIGW